MSTQRSFSDWLDAIEALHPLEMELGLARTERVYATLGRPSAGKKTVVVAGTNGKGSCIAALESMALRAGLRVGAYTSPHLRRFSERLRIDGRELEEAAWSAAFADVEAARGDVALTFFEFTTLAALRLLGDAEVDLALLEVGLGGRGDAVNIISADVAAVVGVALDHTEILGADRERIGAEKAAIFRRDRPAVCGDADPPASVRGMAGEIGAVWHGLGEQFRFEPEAGRPARWRWLGRGYCGDSVEYRDLPAPRLPASALATAFQVWHLLRVAPCRAELVAGVRATLPGRWQLLRRDGATLLLDVAHNPAAARALAAHLRRLRPRSRALAVCGMAADKDMQGFARALSPQVESWFVAAPPTPRAASAATLAQAVRAAGGHVAAQENSLTSALARALASRQGDQLVVVCGSFHTVGNALSTVSPPLSRMPQPQSQAIAV